MKPRTMALAVALACMSFASLASEPPQDATETLAAVLVNGRQILDARLLQQSADGDIWLTVDEWSSIPGLVLDLDGKLGSLSAREVGLTPTFDEALQAFDLKAPASLLPRQRLSGQKSPRITEVAPQPRGALVNYDLAGQVDDQGRYAVSVAHDARIGVLGGTVVSTGQVNTSSRGEVEYRRGVSTWHRDNLKSGTSVAVGDVFTPRSTLTGTVNLAGIRVASDRSLRRDEDFLPVPLIGGIADTRSTAEIFVNGDKLGGKTVKAGPWDLGQVPVLPGSNDVRLVVRDQFGREEVINQRFYMAPNNLPKGQNEWEIAAGLVRQKDDIYTTPAVAGRLNYGATPWWTVGTSVRATKEASNLSLSNQFVLGSAGTLSVDAAASRSEEGRGSAISMAYDYRTRNWAAHLGHAHYSDDFWQLSETRADRALAAHASPASTSTASVSLTPRGRPWSVSLAGAKIDYHKGNSRQRVDLGARYRVGSNDFGAGIGRAMDTGEQSVYLTWRHTFNSGVSLSTSARKAPELAIQAQASGNVDIGNQRVRWSASADHQDSGTRIQGTASTRLENGALSVKVDHDRGGTQVSGRFRGSIWAGEGGITAQHTSPGSFVVVEVPGQAGIPVSGVAGFAGRTNKHGFAVVPNVQPLVKNQIRIDGTDLPLEVSLETNGKTVAAGRRGGAKVRFEVLSEQMVELRLVQHGEPLGASSKITTDTETVPVGVGGIAVLMKPVAGQSLTVANIDGGACKATLPEELPGIEQTLELECKETLQ